MQFVYVVGHDQKKDLGRNLFVTTQKELAESIVLLDHAKSALGLD